MKFSLLVVTTDRLSLVERLLHSLAAQTYGNFEVLLVHGPDCPEGARSTAGNFPGLDIRLFSSQDHCLSRSRNLALHETTGDIIAFPDDDCVYCPDTLENASTVFKAHPEADVLLAVRRDLREDVEEARKYFSCGGSAPSNSPGRGMLPLHPRLIFQRVTFARSRLEQAHERTLPPMREDDLRTRFDTNDAEKLRVKGRPEQAQGRTLHSRESISNPVRGGAFRAVNRYSAFRHSGTIVQFYRKQCVKAVGPFDERLGPGTGLPYGCGEDTDYVLRALAAGFGVYRARSVVVRHAPFSIRDPGIGAKIEAYARGRMYLLRKHDLPLWFVLANIAWPLLCIPGECLRECLAVASFRRRMFSARLSSFLGAAG
ncbi:MAG: glycosyltransferase [Desulfovibrio sp.]|nr:glycosyltransferase [Desulfovibrio sp.]